MIDKLFARAKGVILVAGSHKVKYHEFYFEINKIEIITCKERISNDHWS